MKFFINFYIIQKCFINIYFNKCVIVILFSKLYYVLPKWTECRNILIIIFNVVLSKTISVKCNACDRFRKLNSYC